MAPIVQAEWLEVERRRYREQVRREREQQRREREAEQIAISKEHAE
jgi:hypothetical protein